MTHIISARLKGMNRSLVHWDKNIYTCVTGQSLLFCGMFFFFIQIPKKREEQKMFSSIEVEKAKELKGNKHIPPKSQR